MTVVSIGGDKIIRGGNGIVDGPVDYSKLDEVMEHVKAKGFGNEEEPDARCRYPRHSVFSFFSQLFFSSLIYIFSELI